MMKIPPILKNAAHQMSHGKSPQKFTNGPKWFQSFLNIIFRAFQIFLHAAFSLIYGGPGEKLPPIDSLLLLDSAVSLALKIRTRKVTSVEVVESFIARIKQVNPTLNCVVDERFQDALEDARKVDALIASGTKTKDELEKEKPFLGVPFTTKDCIAVKGMSNTGGLWRRRNYIPEEDADVIALMRNAGGIPLAVTNVSELCMFWESFNKVYGRTSNVYNTNHIVGGSSGGEGCILSAAASPMGYGSDIGGSVRMPAFFNGVFGHKCTTRTGSLVGHNPCPIDPEQIAMLTVGPMSRFATDLLPMLKVMAPQQRQALRLDEKVDITRLKYYYMEDDGGGLLISPVEPEIKDCIRRVVSYLKTSHGITAQRVHLKDLRLSMAVWFAKMRAPGPNRMGIELANREEPYVNVVRELLKMPFGMSPHTLPVLLVGLLEKFNVPYDSPQHRYLVEKCEQLKQQFQDLLGNDGVFFYPTHPTAAPYHVEPLVKPFNVAYTAIFNSLGLPSTHCPMGLNKQGLPIGFQVVGAQQQDRLTLAVAVELEKAFGGWVPPSISV